MPGHTDLDPQDMVRFGQACFFIFFVRAGPSSERNSCAATGLADPSPGPTLLAVGSRNVSLVHLLVNFFVTLNVIPNIRTAAEQLSPILTYQFNALYY
mgnify:CR=1 FL=1